MGGRRPRTRSRDEVVGAPKKQRKFRHFLKGEEDLQNPTMEKHCEEEEVIIEVEKEEEMWPNWSEILPEILELIMTRMHIGDRIQASRVCKHWRCPAVGTTTLKSRTAASYGSPCCVRLLDGNKRCMITDPLRKEGFMIDTPTLPDSVIIMCSGYGWLLLAGGSPSGGYDPIVFFNPLTRKIIELPTLKVVPIVEFSFSSTPTSPHCVVTAMNMISAKIQYCRPGDKTWTIVNVRHNEGICRGLRKPIFFKDRIYVWCHNDRHELRIYDLSSGVLTKVIECRCFSTDICNFVIDDDKLMSVRINFSKGLINIFEFDESNDKWIPMKSLGERLVFFSSTNCMFIKAATPVGELGEKVHVICDKEIMSYLCIWDSHTYSWNQLRIIRKYQDAPEYKISVARRSACWIELMP